MPTSIPSSNPRQQLGQLGESLAEQHYRKLGYRCVARNWRYQRAEVDRILIRGQTMVILEVKTRRGTMRSEPEYLRQWRRVAHAGTRFARQWPWEGDIRLDMAWVDLSSMESPKIRIILDVWDGWG